MSGEHGNGGREPSSASVTAISENADLALDAAALEGRRLVSPDELSRYLGVERSWVYDHAPELDPRRLGSGPKARLRFSIPRVDYLLTCCPSRGSQAGGKADPEPIRARRRTRPLGTNVDLLPVKGSEAA